MTSSGSMQFKHNLGSHWTRNGRVPELAVAYDERYVRDVYVKHSFSDPKCTPGNGVVGHAARGSEPGHACRSKAMSRTSDSR